jgi:hypothetical protein
MNTLALPGKPLHVQKGGTGRLAAGKEARTNTSRVAYLSVKETYLED